MLISLCSNIAQMSLTVWVIGLSEHDYLQTGFLSLAQLYLHGENWDFKERNHCIIPKSSLRPNVPFAGTEQAASIPTVKYLPSKKAENRILRSIRSKNKNVCVCSDQGGNRQQLHAVCSLIYLLQFYGYFLFFTITSLKICSLSP